MKIKNGDRVVITTGKEKGKDGVVTKIDLAKNQVYIDGLNIRKIHVKPSQANPEGGIFEKEGPIHISNVLLIEGKGDKAIVSRVGYKLKNGKKVRYLKKSGQELSK